jgi:hypothetical protein
MRASVYSSIFSQNERGVGGEVVVEERLEFLPVSSVEIAVGRGYAVDDGNIEGGEDGDMVRSMAWYCGTLYEGVSHGSLGGEDQVL